MREADARVHADLLMKALRQYGRMILWWVTIATTALVLVIAGPSRFLRSWPISISIALVTSTFCYWGVQLVSWTELLALRFRRLPKKPPQHGTLWYFFLTALLMPAGLFLGFRITAVVAGAMGRTLSQPDWSDYRYSLLFGLSVCGVMFLVEMRREAKLAQREAELHLTESENARLQAHVAALTAQMNPHLLFNSLNTVASLIKSDPDAAEEMTVQVSEMLRRRLQAGRKEMHSLEEELTICSDYLDIEKRRFGDRLVATLDTSGVDVRAITVPVLCVQPLVENAVKYAVSPRAKGGEVAIKVQQIDGLTTISVEDDGPGLGRSSAPSGSRTSIENCRKRLQLRYGGNASLDLTDRQGGGCRAALAIPQQPNTDGEPARSTAS